MGNNGYKYMYIDFQANQLKLFNLDHSPYSTTNVPVSLVNTGEYTVGYVTKALFDCDPTSTPRAKCWAACMATPT